MATLSEFGTRYPFHPFPTGWFAVGFTDELGPGDVRPLRYFDQDLVLFRTAGGAVVVADAHCPHLGAHLGYDSRVEGEAIVCPFHAWKFAADGRCIAVPFAKSVPPRAHIRTWETAERGGMILIWHDLDGRAPQWTLPEWDERRARAGAGFHTLHDEFGAAHPQDVFENGVDFAHFPGVHSSGRAVSGGAVVADAHRFYSRVRILPKDFAGVVDASIGSTVDSETIGGGLSRVESRTPTAPGVVTVYYVSVTPVDAGLSHYFVRQLFLIEDGCPMKDGEIDTFTQLAASHGEKEQWSDGKIWPHKKYVAEPMLSAVDGPILKYREWYAQFHPRTTSAAAAGA